MNLKNYREIDIIKQMESEMQRLADEALRGFFADIPSPNKFWQPRVDVHETATEIVVKIELAGVAPDQINVSISDDDRLLTISGQRVEQDVERRDRIRCYQLEIYFGPFERTVVLPADIHLDKNNISATYSDGFLVVVLPKLETPPIEKRRIPINDLG